MLRSSIAAAQNASRVPWNSVRGSVREAMKILSAYGLIDVKVGDGTYIASSLRSGMIEPLLFSFLLSDTDYAELAEFRKYIELDIAELIIAHRGENEKYITLLQANVAYILQLQKEHAPVEAFVENDMEFHRWYGKASCNYLIESVYKFIMDFFSHSIASTHRIQDPGTKSYECHASILDAIEKCDPSIAKKSIEFTVDVWKELQVDI